MSTQHFEATTAQIQALRNQVRERIYLGATELKELWINLEMQDWRDSPEGSAALDELKGSWQSLHTQLYGRQAAEGNHVRHRLPGIAEARSA